MRICGLRVIHETRVMRNVVRSRRCSGNVELVCRRSIEGPWRPEPDKQNYPENLTWKQTQVASEFLPRRLANGFKRPKRGKG